MTKKPLLILVLWPLMGLADEYVIIRPFEGSKLASRETKQNQKILLPEAPWDASGKAGKLIELKGSYSKSVWKNPRGKKTQEIYDGYVRELTSAGFKPLYACAGKDCGAPAAGWPLGEVHPPPDRPYALSPLTRHEQ